MKLSDYDLKDLFNALRTFSYNQKVNEEDVTINVELYPEDKVPIVEATFMQSYGGLVADDILDNKNFTLDALAENIKMLYVQNWKHYLGMWQSEYNPLWNVDGTETHTVVTTFGKITTFTNGKVETTSQLENGTTETDYGRTDTNMQVQESIQKENVYATNSTSALPRREVLNDDGERRSEAGGKDTVTINNGKIEVANTGDDVNKNSGKDQVVDTLVRGGNIGVTMTQQLLTAEKDFWTHFDFFSLWFKDICKFISLPIFE